MGVNVTEPTDIFKNNVKVAVINRFFDSELAQRGHRNKYVNFTLDDYENDKYYTLKQVKGDLFKKQIWALYEDDRFVAEFKIEFHTIGLGIAVRSKDLNLYIKFAALVKKEATIYKLSNDSSEEIGRTYGYLADGKISIEEEAFNSSGVELGEFLALVHTEWCAVGRL